MVRKAPGPACIIAIITISCGNMEDGLMILFITRGRMAYYIIT